MSKSADEMLLKCVDPTCSLLRKDHPVKSTRDSSSSTFKMPSIDNFPKFRDPKDKLMHDPYEFLAKLERQLKFHGVDIDRYGTVLVNCVDDRLQQDWIESNILTTCTSWEEIKRRFRERYDDPTIKNKLILELEGCHQEMNERVFQYTEKYQSLVVRVSGGAPIDTNTNIVMCERGFIPIIREKLAAFRADQTQKQQFAFEFKTLADLYKAAATIESGLAPRPGRYRRTEHKVAQRRNARVNNVQSTSTGQTSSVNSSPSIHKIEINAHGQPVNVNKKHKAKSRSSNSSSTTGTLSSSGSLRGGLSQRGGISRGGINHHARGGHMHNTVSHGNERMSLRTDRDTQHRGLQSNQSSQASTFGGECFNCHRRGHRASECPLKTAINRSTSQQ